MKVKITIENRGKTYKSIYEKVKINTSPCDICDLRNTCKRNVNNMDMFCDFAGMLNGQTDNSTSIHFKRIDNND